jgi:hypothetical protein
MGTEWMVWYAHVFSSGQWVLEPAEDDIPAEQVLIVSDGIGLWCGAEGLSWQEFGCGESGGLGG